MTSDFCPTSCAVSWGAILAGTVAAMAASLVLFTLGSGLGLSAVSPMGMGAAGVTIGASIWLVVMQWFSSGLGGYIAGRLRNRWEGLHGDEVFFRDSAHGLSAWSAATILTAVLVMASSGAAIKAGTVAAAKTDDKGGYDYFIDGMYRGAEHAPGANMNVRSETDRIITESLKEGSISEEDRAYLATLVARQTKMKPEEAEIRVDSIMAEVSEARAKTQSVIEEARKKAATFSILTALSMVIGAFIASVTAIIGGRHRDQF